MHIHCCFKHTVFLNKKNEVNVLTRPVLTHIIENCQSDIYQQWVGKIPINCIYGNYSSLYIYICALIVLSHNDRGVLALMVKKEQQVKTLRTLSFQECRSRGTYRPIQSNNGNYHVQLSCDRHFQPHSSRALPIEPYVKSFGPTVEPQERLEDFSICELCSLYKRLPCIMVMYDASSYTCIHVLYMSYACPTVCKFKRFPPENLFFCEHCRKILNSGIKKSCNILSGSCYHAELTSNLKHLRLQGLNDSFKILTCDESYPVLFR